MLTDIGLPLEAQGLKPGNPLNDKGEVLIMYIIYTTTILRLINYGTEKKPLKNALSKQEQLFQQS